MGKFERVQDPFDINEALGTASARCQQFREVTVTTGWGPTREVEAICLSAGFVGALSTNVDVSSCRICGVFKALVSPKSVT